MSINTPAHYIYEPDQWPAKYPPRPYLCAAVVHALEAVDAGQRGIVHLPTGTGKTVQVGKVTEHYYHRGKRTLFLHHRREFGRKLCQIPRLRSQTPRSRKHPAGRASGLSTR